MNIAPFSSMLPDDSREFEAFSLAHAMAHESIYDTMLTLGFVIRHYPFFDIEKYNRDWLLDHQSEHDALYTALGLVGMPDLASSDLKDDDQLKTWMELHEQVHQNLNLVLSL